MKKHLDGVDGVPNEISGLTTGEGSLGWLPFERCPTHFRDRFAGVGSLSYLALLPDEVCESCGESGDSSVLAKCDISMSRRRNSCVLLVWPFKGWLCVSFAASAFDASSVAK